MDKVKVCLGDHGIAYTYISAPASSPKDDTIKISDRDNVANEEYTIVMALDPDDAKILIITVHYLPGQIAKANPNLSLEMLKRSTGLYWARYEMDEKNDEYRVTAKIGYKNFDCDHLITAIIEIARLMGPRSHDAWSGFDAPSA